MNQCGDDASGQSSDVRGVGASVEAVGEGAEEQRFDEAEDGLDDAPHRHDAHVRGDAVDGAVPRAQVHHQRLGQGNRRRLAVWFFVEIKTIILLQCVQSRHGVRSYLLFYMCSCSDF